MEAKLETVCIRLLSISIVLTLCNVQVALSEAELTEILRSAYPMPKAEVSEVMQVEVREETQRERDNTTVTFLSEETLVNVDEPEVPYVDVVVGYKLRTPSEYSPHSPPVA